MNNKLSHTLNVGGNFFMLFDGDDGLINDIFLGIDNSEVDLVDVKEGFLRGNMFKDEYIPYRNLSYEEIKVKSDRDAKLLNVMQYEFAINDLNLYLDVHPNDKYALNEFNRLVEEVEKVKEEYVKLYGPLEVCDNIFDKFKWIDNPWPFEDDGGSMYV